MKERLNRRILNTFSVLQVQKIEGKGGILPPSKEGDCGYDLITSKDTLIPARNTTAIDIPTGVKVKIPTGYWGLVIGRSGALRRSGLDIKAGVIDNGFTGELLACCYNRTEKDIWVKTGTKLVQLILLPILTARIKSVNSLPQTERGENGFGSTDEKKS